MIALLFRYRIVVGNGIVLMAGGKLQYRLSPTGANRRRCNLLYIPDACYREIGWQANSCAVGRPRSRRSRQFTDSIPDRLCNVHTTMCDDLPVSDNRPPFLKNDIIHPVRAIGLHTDSLIG